MTFDIRVNYTQGVSKFLSQSYLVQICLMFGIPYIPVMYSGSFNEMLKINNVFESTIYKMFGNAKAGK
jgi:hypothetical protein